MSAQRTVVLYKFMLQILLWLVTGLTNNVKTPAFLGVGYC